MTDHRHNRTIDSESSPIKDPAGGAAERERARTAAIVEVARDLARSVPPPRGAPYFCLDSDVAYDLSVLDAFCARGIFRKYEFALDLGSGLGGRARWLAARSGCRVLGIDPRLSVVAGAALLNRRAHMDEQVAFHVGCLTALPLRARVFTHVWVVNAFGAEPSAGIFAEGFRVLRPGGHFALQCPMPPPPQREELRNTLKAVGFANLETRRVECTELPPPCRLARDRWRVAASHVLQERETPPLQPVSDGLQIFATRPA
jgi:SAM-dependent methyltransferase